MITLQGFDTWDNLILLDMMDFDLIMDMDVLAPLYAMLDCYARIITFAIMGISLVVLLGSVSHILIGIILYIQAHRLISTGCSNYLAYVHEVTVETSIVESVPILCEFADVFLIDLLRLPLEWEIDISIEVELNTKPISIPPHRMAPAELKDSVHNFRAC